MFPSRSVFSIWLQSVQVYRHHSFHSSQSNSSSSPKCVLIYPAYGKDTPRVGGEISSETRATKMKLLALFMDAPQVRSRLLPYAILFLLYKNMPWFPCTTDSFFKGLWDSNQVSHLLECLSWPLRLDNKWYNNSHFLVLPVSQRMSCFGGRLGGGQRERKTES